MRPGILGFGMIILIISAIFYYIPKPVATPANPDGDNDVTQASLDKYWSVIGMALGVLVMLLALILPPAKVDRRHSPMKEYAKTSAGQGRQ